MFPHGWAIYLLVLLLLCMLTFIAYPARGSIRSWLGRFILSLKTLLFFTGIKKNGDASQFDELLKASGYAYDPRQDIFYSVLEPWQRHFGYCRLYDEAAAPMGMIIDCEPVYFEYGGKRWLIEFWKGQYDLTCGCEIGIYTTIHPDLNIPGIFQGTFYDCAAMTDLLPMYYLLRKNGKTLFTRNGTHWWLTGFKLGEYSEPSELSMFIYITFKDKPMRNAFLKGMRNTGYSRHEYFAIGKTVSFIYGKPHSKQPVSRSKETDILIQKKNRLLCDVYRAVTKGCLTMEDKFAAVKAKAPELIDYITGLGRPKKLYEMYESIRRM